MSNPFISSATAGTATAREAVKNDRKTEEKTPAETKKETEKAAVYEKNTTSKEPASAYTSNGKKIKNESVIAQMKADLATRTSQLQDIVTQMMQKQGQTLAKSDDLWSFLADGNFTVTEAAKAQAQADIAEDGYWGVEQTSDRILSFAKALSGDDASKADEMLAAFKKGFEAATKSWGKDLPDISQRTYDAVVEKFDNWKKEASSSSETT